MVDLRYADFTSSEVTIHAYSFLGGQTILLPPEVNVEIKGFGVMGGFEHDVDRDGYAGCPAHDHLGFFAVGRRRHQAQEAPTAER